MRLAGVIAMQEQDTEFAPDDDGHCSCSEDAALGKLSSALEVADRLETLGSVLRGFRESLIDHFAREEAEGGLFQGIASAAPHHAVRVTELRGEHREMVATVEDLCSRAAEAVEQESRIVREVGDLLERLRLHDANECELLMDSVERDIGGDG